MFLSISKYIKKQKTNIVFALASFILLLIVLLSISNGQTAKNDSNKRKLLYILNGEKHFLLLPPEWKSIERGIGFKKINIVDHLEDIKVQLRLYRFNPAFFDINVLCSKDFGYKRADVRTLGKSSGSVAIINSSYFDTEGNPIAYLKCNGKVINSKIATHGLYSGVFFVKQGQPSIVHVSKFNPSGVSDAVQVGPRLISKGEYTIGLKNIHSVDHRSGIALSKKGEIIIYTTNSKFGGIAWENLRNILKLKEIDVYEVLNLDGGGSSQMYISTENFEEYTRGMTGVPSAIAFFRKK